jgi:hypothetical protein
VVWVSCGGTGDEGQGRRPRSRRRGLVGTDDTAGPDMRERQRQGWVGAWVTGVSLPESQRGEGAHRDGAEVDTGAGV